MAREVTKDHVGVVVPILTPLKKNRSVDVAALRRLIQHLIAEQVDGVFLFGSSSEITRLDSRDKNKILLTVMEECYGKVKTYMGVLQSGLKSGLEDVRLAQDSGVSCLVACPPYYYPVSDQEIAAYFTAIAGSTELPVMLYNIPQTTGAPIGLGIYDELLRISNIVGVKDSCGSLAQLQQIITKYSSDSFSVLIGSEDISYEGMKAGADGLVPSLGNAFPKLLVEFYRATIAADTVKASHTDAVIQAFNAIHPVNQSFLSPIATRKYALFYLGLCEPWMSEPYIDLDAATKQSVERFIDSYREDLV